MSHGWIETLQVVMRDLMRIGAQRCQFQATDHRLEREWINLDGIENVFATKRRWKVVVNLREERIAAEAGATVVTKNRVDFGRVPGLAVVDWSV